MLDACSYRGSDGFSTSAITGRNKTNLLLNLGVSQIVPPTARFARALCHSRTWTGVDIRTDAILKLRVYAIRDLHHVGD